MVDMSDVLAEMVDVQALMSTGTSAATKAASVSMLAGKIEQIVKFDTTVAVTLRSPERGHWVHICTPIYITKRHRSARIRCRCFIRFEESTTTVVGECIELPVDGGRAEAA